MTTRVRTGIPRQAAATTTALAPVTAPETLRRPPTLFAREAPIELVRAGYDVARRAIEYRREGVSIDDAVTRLLAHGPDPGAVRIAEAYLAYTEMDASGVQVDALFIVEETLHRLTTPAERRGLRRFSRR